MITKDDITDMHPADDAFVITLDTDIPMTRGVYIGGGANLRVQMASGAIVTFTALATGVVHPLRIVRVYSSGTTATNIVGLT